jgi:hypothetical protein
MIEKLWKDGLLHRNEQNVGKHAVMDPTRSLRNTAWGTEYRSNDMTPTLRTNNDLYIIKLGEGKACHVRDLKVPERAALQGVVAATLKGAADTDIKRWLGSAYPTPMCAVLIFRFVHAMMEAQHGPLQRGPKESWPPTLQQSMMERPSEYDEDSSIFSIAGYLSDSLMSESDERRDIQRDIQRDMLSDPLVGFPWARSSAASNSSSSSDMGCPYLKTNLVSKRKSVGVEKDTVLTIDLDDTQPGIDSDNEPLLNTKKRAILKTTEGDSQDSCQESPHRAIPKRFFNAEALKTEEAAKENDMKVVGNSKNAEAVKTEEAAEESDSSESTSTEEDSQDKDSAMEDSPQPMAKLC